LFDRAQQVIPVSHEWQRSRAAARLRRRRPAGAQKR
jgi:hypothetical protein